MRPRLSLLLLIALSVRVDVGECDGANNGETRIELPPILIECRLNDIAVISAPVVDNARYYLSRPDGKIIKLDDSIHKERGNQRQSSDVIVPNLTHGTDVINTKSTQRSSDSSYSDVTNSVLTRNDVINPENQSTTFKLFNLNGKDAFNSTKDVFGEHLMKMKPTDFMVGPFGEGDHGNWVLNVYYTDLNLEAIVELFQVVSVEIVDTVPARKSTLELIEGGTFELSFAYPIKGIESCELRAPRPMADRFYDRDVSALQLCGYVVPNVTREDEGVWTIVGVGPIVYEATVRLKVHNKYYL